MTLIYLPPSSAPQNWKYVHKFTSVKCSPSSLFCDRQFPGAINRVCAGCGEKHVGVEMENNSKMKTGILSETSPTSNPLSLCWLQRAFSDGAVRRQGMVYVDSVFFSKLPEVEPGEVLLESSEGSFLACVTERGMGQTSGSQGVICRSAASAPPVDLLVWTEKGPRTQPEKLRGGLCGGRDTLRDPEQPHRMVRTERFLTKSGSRWVVMS